MATWLFFSTLFLVAAQDRQRYVPYFAAGVGIEHLYAFTNNYAVERLDSGKLRYFREERNKYGVGFTGKCTGSVIVNFLEHRKNRRLLWGDIFHAECSTGGLRDQLLSKSNLYVGYNFFAGIMASYLLGAGSELSIGLIPLKFSSNNVAPNFSGSSVFVRYGRKDFWAELGFEARDLSYAGWLLKGTLNPKQVFLELNLRKVFSKRLGLRAEWASNYYLDKEYGATYQNFFSSVQVFFAKNIF